VPGGEPSRRSASTEWERCIGRGTGSSGATWRSRCCPRRSRRMPSRLARFRREARVLAALNHPHRGDLRPRGIGRRRNVGPRARRGRDARRTARERRASYPLPYNIF
jgi:hypothetical protein